MITFALVVYRLKISTIEQRGTGSPFSDILDSLKFIKDHSIFLFLIAMAFFNSFFGMAYITRCRSLLKTSWV
jgi:hypothetical protein